MGKARGTPPKASTTAKTSKTSRAAAAPSVAPATHVADAPLVLDTTDALDLQRTAGNAATTLAVQRKGGAGEPGSRPTLYVGKKGEAVGVLQQKLNAARASTPPLVIDAEFGSKTLAAVRAFQKANSLAADGVVGKKTWGSLDLAASGGGKDDTGAEKPVNSPDEANPVAIPDAGTSIHPTVGAGHTTTGPAVEELQHKLNIAGAAPPVPITSTFDAATSKAVIDFQTANGIAPANGVADAATWAQLDIKGAGSTMGRVEKKWHENVGGNPNIGMTSRYTWRLTPEDNPSTMEVTAKIQFTSNPMKASWPGLVESAWNKFSAVNLGTLDVISINFKLESVSAGADNVVDVKTGTGRANAGEWYLGDKDEARTIPHEYGHLIGLQDEYQLTAADYERTTGRVAPVGATEATSGASATKVASEFTKAIAGTGPTGVKDADALAVVQNHGLKQGAFSQQVMNRYTKENGTDLIQDLRGLASPNEFFLVEPFTYSSGSMMGDFIRHEPDNEHDHGVQPRHVREFVGYIRDWGRAKGKPDLWVVV